MDYPKSVPSVGLVNGQFVDENPVNGTPGSLIPAEWGNSVTDEVLNVIKAANIVPDESRSDQLKQAIISISRVVGAVANTYNSVNVDQYGRVVNGSLIVPFQDIQPFPVQVYRKNRIINGSFDIWQRGESGLVSGTSSVASGFGPDRWQVFVPQGISSQWSKVTFAPGASPNESRMALSVTHTGAVAGANIRQRIENVETGAGKTVTASFYVKSSVPQTLTVALRQNFGASTGGSADVDTQTNINVGSTYQKISVTLTLPSILGKTKGTAGNDCLEFILISSAAMTHTIELAAVQLEIGSVATEYEYKSVVRELEDCQRYFEKTLDVSVAPADGAGANGMLSSLVYGGQTGPFSQPSVNWRFKVEKRINPSVKLYTPYGNGPVGQWRSGDNATSTANAGVNYIGTGGCVIYNNDVGVRSQAYYIHASADAEL
ncbi:hypothetical protein [Pseudomonas batumici]|uniref:Prophage tail fiber protein n=1 Tax=Pseudomonas batumici TaxID=226910 RepID=A0A0C2IJL3_9PSED|nr:hypothetical protein [Pseudomonas batumici]KIH85077.1 Prophage tail fiber protein [Pseudomonas batumici]